MTTTRQALRQRLSEEIGDWFGSTTTANGAALNHVADGLLAEEPNDVFNEKYVIVTSGTASGEIRRVQDTIQTSGTIVAYRNFTAGTVLSGVTYEVHKWNPALKNKALNRASELAYPFLYREVIEDNLVANNILPNSHFEDWDVSTAPDFYYGTSATLTEETTTMRGPRGTSAMKLVASANPGYAQTDQGQQRVLLDLQNHKLTFESWAWCDTASRARLTLVDTTNGGTATTTNSSFHTGGSTWEKLSIERNLPDDLYSLSFRFSVASSGTAYFDNARAYGRTVYEYRMPKAIKDLSEVWVQVDGDCDDIEARRPIMARLDGWYLDKVEEDSNVRYLRIPYGISDLKKIVLVGKGYLTQPSTDAATMEINDPHIGVLTAKAAAWLYAQEVSGISAEERTRYKELSDYWEREYLRRRRENGMPIRSKRVRFPV